MRSKVIELGGVECLALRVSFTGDLGWELHCKTEDQAKLYAALLEAGKEFGAGPVGARALMSMRVEKGYGSWSREYSPEYYPHEVGLAALCKMDKDFLHKAAAEKALAEPEREQLVLIHVDEAAVTASNADATGRRADLPRWQGDRARDLGHLWLFGGDEPRAWLCQGGHSRPGDAVDVMILGQPHKAVILHEPPFDPEGKRLRA